MQQMWNRLQLLFAHGVSTLVGNDKVQAKVLDGEVLDNLARVEPYGFSYHPQPGSQSYLLFPSGDRSYGVAIMVGDKRYQMDLQSGEVSLHDDIGHSVTLQRGGIAVAGGGHDVTVTGAPTVVVTGGDVVADGVSLKDHVHSGVQPGSGLSGPPVGGGSGGTGGGGSGGVTPDDLNNAVNAAEASAVAALAAELAAVTAKNNAISAKVDAELAKAATEGFLDSAATYASNAANSATAAGNSATAANTSASSAATSATTAGTSASNASTSATNAANSATAAGNSATAANEYKTSAQSYATAAGDSASLASTYASNAASSQTASGLSASAAATHASSASTSASEAASSAAAAAIEYSTLSSTVDGHNTSITNLTSTQNGLTARYGVTINNNGHISGFAMHSDAVANGGNPTSAFVIQADKFAIVDPSVPYTEGNAPVSAKVPFKVLGGITYIKNAAIESLSLGANKIELGALTAPESISMGYFAPTGINSANSATTQYDNVIYFPIATVDAAVKRLLLVTLTIQHSDTTAGFISIDIKNNGVLVRNANFDVPTRMVDGSNISNHTHMFDFDTVANSTNTLSMDINLHNAASTNKWSDASNLSFTARLFCYTGKR